VVCVTVWGCVTVYGCAWMCVDVWLCGCEVRVSNPCRVPRVAQGVGTDFGSSGVHAPMSRRSRLRRNHRRRGTWRSSTSAAVRDVFSQRIDVDDVYRALLCIVRALVLWGVVASPLPWL